MSMLQQSKLTVDNSLSLTVSVAYGPWWVTLRGAWQGGLLGDVHAPQVLIHDPTATWCSLEPIPSQIPRALLGPGNSLLRLHCMPP